MRTSIDLPDAMAARIREVCDRRGVTFRALVLDSLRRVLDEPQTTWHLADRSVGSGAAPPISSAAINDAIDALREGR